MNRWGQVGDARLDYSTSTFPRNYSPSISYSFSSNHVICSQDGQAESQAWSLKTRGSLFLLSVISLKMGHRPVQDQSLLLAFNQKDQKQFLSSSRISSYQDQRVWSCHAAYHVETVCLKIKLHWGKQSWDMERVVQMAAGTTHSWQPYQKSLKFQSHKPT